MTTELPVITATIEIGLDTLMPGTGRPYQDSDGEWCDGPPLTLAERVAQLVADKLAQAQIQDYHVNLQAVAEERAQKWVEQRFAELFDTASTATDQWGNPRGTGKTFAEFIDAKITEWINRPAPRDGYSTKPSPFAALIEQQIERSFASTLQDTVKTAKERAINAVRDQAAAVIAETIRRSTPGL